MKTQRHWLYLQHEAPAIGCGWRLCDIQVGRKWAYLRANSYPFRVKISRKNWCLIEAAMMKYWDRNRNDDNPSLFDTFRVDT